MREGNEAEPDEEERERKGSGVYGRLFCLSIFSFRFPRTCIVQVMLSFCRITSQLKEK